MATEVRFRRGSTVEHSSFTGAGGEMTVDTTKDTLVAHDGSTAGGHPMAKESDMTTAQGDITTLEGDMTTAQGDITTLEARSRKNLLINGNLDFWQRGTTQTSGTYGSADRWFFFAFTSIDRSTDVPFGSTYSAKITPTATGDVNMRQKIERGEIFINGKECVLSFWAKADSARNISTDLSDIPGALETHALTTSWQKFSRTVTGNATANPFIDFSNQDASAVPYYITQVQFEIGDEATDFEYRPLGEELALCQRYYCKSYDMDVLPGTADAGGGVVSAVASAGVAFIDIRFPVSMRVSPTILRYSRVTGAQGYVRMNGSGGSDIVANVAYQGNSGVLIWTNDGVGGNGQVEGHYTADAEI